MENTVESRKNKNCGSFHPINAIAWQDSLLQAYRNFQLILQSIFLAVGVGLVIALLSFTESKKLWITSFILWVIGSISIVILFRLKNVIKARGQDVYYWQKQLIQMEYSIETEKLFTKFKLTQILKHERNSPTANLIDLDRLSEEQVKILIEGSDAGMRGVVETTIVSSIIILWILFACVSFLVLFFSSKGI